MGFNSAFKGFNKVIIKWTVHYIVHLQCTFSLSRMYESKGFWCFSVGTGTKEDESTWRIWAARFHHVTSHSHLAHVSKHEPFISLIFNFFSGHGKPWITETADSESADTEAWLYTASSARSGVLIGQDVMPLLFTDLTPSCWIICDITSDIWLIWNVAHSV
jgi:hypothetical protein